MDIDEFDHLPIERQNELWIEYLKQANIPPRPVYSFQRWLLQQRREQA